ncbi:MAG: D-TA family PLP-dependent enzyme [candidate division KSB1 bacterium]|nr:D-TA family PLP-dependent enzyme [candidate division KSB1 bacterium]
MNVNDLDTPAVLIDLDKLEQNIHCMAAFAKTQRINLRPHIKTHKIPEIAHLQIHAGAVGLTCQKLGEAEIMAAHGVKDIFITYEIVGEHKLNRLARLKHHASVCTAVDSEEVMAPLAARMEQEGLHHGVLIEIDTGLNRCGVLPGESAVRLVQRLQQYPSLEFRGIFTHEGHVYNAGTSEELERRALKAADDMLHTAKLLREHGFPCEVISVGSTPSALIIGKTQGITELRPGNYVFYDRMQLKLGSCTEDQIAASVLATVVSRPAPERAIVDAGNKTMGTDNAAEFNNTIGIVVGHPDLIFHYSSEEHGRLTSKTGNTNLKVGDRVRLIPNHACGMMNLHDEVYGIRGDTVETVWRVAARGKVR